MEKRVLKFRAWDNLSPKMYIGHSLTISANGSLCFLDDDGQWKEPEPGRIEVMQYTGLKDKNERDIYEGDIVKIKRYGNGGIGSFFTIGVVDFSSGNFWIRGDGYAEIQHWHFNDSEREVLGNIYEHKQLLNEKVA